MITVKNRPGRSQSQSREEVVETTGVKAVVCMGAGVRWRSKSKLESHWYQS